MLIKLFLGVFSGMFIAFFFFFYISIGIHFGYYFIQLAQQPNSFVASWAKDLSLSPN